jgi:hypothetical protein
LPAAAVATNESAAGSGWQRPEQAAGAIATTIAASTVLGLP